ncbi:WD40-repeat-containing domain protein, partial [Ganoderma leucocontextum]
MRSYQGNRSTGCSNTAKGHEPRILSSSCIGHFLWTSQRIMRARLPPPTQILPPPMHAAKPDSQHAGTTTCGLAGSDPPPSQIVAVNPLDAPVVERTPEPAPRPELAEHTMATMATTTPTQHSHATLGAESAAKEERVSQQVKSLGATFPDFHFAQPVLEMSDPKYISTQAVQQFQAERRSIDLDVLLAHQLMLEDQRQLPRRARSHSCPPRSEDNVKPQQRHTHSPLLPWEVIERIIGHFVGHPQTLCSFSLTCRQLRPRAFCLMMARVTLKSRTRTFAFVNFLRDNPHLKPFVHSIVVEPTDFPPFPLLPTLSNLSEIGFTSRKDNPALSALHHSTLTCFHRFGTHIRTLRLFRISFATYLPFARILLAFPNMVHLTCEGVGIKTAGDRAPLNGIRRRLPEQMRLKTLVVDSVSQTGSQRGGSASVGSLLFDSSLAPSTVESLSLGEVPGSDIFSHQSDWSRLRSLVLHFQYAHQCITDALKRLQEFRHPTLKEVMLELCSVSLLDIIADLSRRGEPQDVYEELEHILLRFSQPGIIWIMKDPLRADRNTFWTRELQKQFPLLSQRGALTLKSEIAISQSAGHDARIHALVVSPDSMWAASGSEDSTIIVWRTINGTIEQQWVAHSYKSIQSLAFSPSSRYLVSGGGKTTAIWDLTQDARKVAILDGHTEAVTSCAWSPNGALIASGSQDASVRLWDAHTFQPLSRLYSGHTRLRDVTLAFSSDGRWLASGSTFGINYGIWNLGSGPKLHKVILTQLPNSDTPSTTADGMALAFDPGSVHLAMATSGRAGVEIWDVLEGKRRVSFGRENATNDISFSRDGRLVLTASSDGTVKIWAADTGAELFSLGGHTGAVRKVCFSPCGEYIASASRDQTVRLWRTSGSCVATFSEHEDAVTHVAFSPDGDT